MTMTGNGWAVVLVATLATGLSDEFVIQQRLISSISATAAGGCASAAKCRRGPPDLRAAAQDAAALNASGAWTDVNYTDTTRTGSWSPHIHLDRTVNMAAVILQQNSSGTAPNATLVGSTAVALNFYLQADPRSLNWYWNELAVPDRISDIALLFAPFMEQRTRPRTLATMARFMERATCGERTGANLDGCEGVAIKRGAQQLNRSLLSASFSRLWREIRIVQPTDPACLAPVKGTQGCATDGIQVDHSFHQHGPELLSGSYGEAYVAVTLGYLSLSEGTAYAPSEAESGLFVGLLLDGMRWMAVGSPAVWDLSVKGRDIGSTPRMLRLGINARYVMHVRRIPCPVRAIIFNLAPTLPPACLLLQSVRGARGGRWPGGRARGVGRRDRGTPPSREHPIRRHRAAAAGAPVVLGERLRRDAQREREGRGVVRLGAPALQKDRLCPLHQRAGRGA
jgi:hypothetical protein